jgi:hypothetical protein
MLVFGVLASHKAPKLAVFPSWLCQPSPRLPFAYTHSLRFCESFCVFLHFSALPEIVSTLFSSSSKLFAKKHRGVRAAFSSSSAVPSFSPALHAPRGTAPFTPRPFPLIQLSPLFSHLLQNASRKSFGITSFQKRGRGGPGSFLCSQFKTPLL